MVLVGIPRHYTSASRRDWQDARNWLPSAAHRLHHGGRALQLGPDAVWRRAL